GRSVLPAESQTALLERAGGNPLYAEEFARMVAARGSEDLALPETVQGIVAARLDTLPREEKELLQDGAVVGKVFWLGAVAAISGAGRPELEGRRKTRPQSTTATTRRSRSKSVTSTRRSQPSRADSWISA